MTEIQHTLRNYLEKNGPKDLEHQVDRMIRSYRAASESSNPQEPLTSVTFADLRLAKVEVAGAVGRLARLQAEFYAEVEDRKPAKQQALIEQADSCEAIGAASSDLQRIRTATEHPFEMRIGDYDHRSESAARSALTAVVRAAVSELDQPGCCGACPMASLVSRWMAEAVCSPIDL